MEREVYLLTVHILTFWDTIYTYVCELQQKNSSLEKLLR
jgi:hypothetical protein